MPVFSHSKQIENGKREGSKLLIDHLKGVYNRAIQNYSNRVEFSDLHRTKHLLAAICWLHDFGKYSKYFQTYLLEPENADYHLKSHSNLGAHTAYQIFKNDTETALLAFYMIKMHHSNLINFDLVLFPENAQSRLEEPEIFEKQLKNLTDHKDFEEYFPAFNEQKIRLLSPKELYKEYKYRVKNKTSIEQYFKIHYLFSLLIESDKLDASNTISYSTIPLPENVVDDRFGYKLPVYKNHELKNLSQNELRNYVRHEVLKNLSKEDILKKRLFTLAAPTGIGKTMTSLDFVLKLRKKIEKEEGYLPQVIYGLPFINIIEQVLEEYEITVRTGRIMGHYQYADIFGTDEIEINNISDTESFYSKRLMAWDTWQCDIVITSFVQLFETLIGNRNKLLKKFHHFADSIIILDEIQTLAIDKLPLIGAALFYLCKYLNARVLIMTATQPKLFELMERELNIEIKEKHLIPVNLLRNGYKVFACFKRTKIIPIIDKKITNEGFLEIFKSKWSQDTSCLIVVNKVNRSIQIYNQLDKYLRNKNVELFYLSTNITPFERKQRINTIKNLIKKKTCILVSTQVVEAGVDLDFDMGFRDLGPIDSIIQVAGRINRENSKTRKYSPLYIVDFGDCNKIYGYVTDSKSRKALRKKEITEEHYEEMVKIYFDDISDRKVSDFKLSYSIFDAMKNLKYSFPTASTKKFETVSDFKIINNSQNGVSVFIEFPDDEIGIKARIAYQKLLKGEMRKHEFDNRYNLAFNQRIIAAPSYLESVCLLKEEEKLSEDIFWIKSERIDDFYDMSTGLKRFQEHKEETFFF